MGKLLPKENPHDRAHPCHPQPVENRRRSLAMLLAIAIGFAAVNLFSGYIAVVYESLKLGAIRGEGLGHVTIAKRGFFARGSLNPEKYLFSQSELQS